MKIDEKYLKIILVILIIIITLGLLLNHIYKMPNGKETLKSLIIVGKWLKESANEILTKFFDTTINKTISKSIIKKKIFSITLYNIFF